MSEDSVRELLRTVGKAYATAEAPLEMEVRLRKEFRSRKRARRLRLAAVCGSVAASLVLAVTLADRQPPPPSASVKDAADPVPAIPPQAAPKPIPLNKERATPVRRQVMAPPSKPAEIVTEFFPLMDPAPPFGRGQLLRVELPASAMQMVGLPIHEQRAADRIQADVLVGEEGLPRAIRFVKFVTR